MQHQNLVLVHTYGSRPDAELAKGALEAAGIDAMIQADTVGAMRDHVAWSGMGFRILVREEDATAAREVLTLPIDELSSGNSDSPDAGAGSDPASRRPLRRFT